MQAALDPDAGTRPVPDAPVPAGLDDDRITAMGLLVEAHAALQCALAPTLDAAGLPAQWFEVLLRLGRTPGHQLRMSELAASMASITPSGLTRVMDRMVDAGLVDRAACPEDRRGTFAVLTEAGLAALTGVIGQHVTDIDRAYTGLFAADELEAFTAALRRIRDHHRPPVSDP